MHRKRAHAKAKDVLLMKPCLLTRNKFLNRFSCRLIVNYGCVWLSVFSFVLK